MKLNTAIEWWRENWSDLINKRVKETVSLELEEVKTDICMLEATVKLKVNLHDYEKTSQHVDELDNVYQSLKREV